MIVPPVPPVPPAPHVRTLPRQALRSLLLSALAAASSLAQNALRDAGNYYDLRLEVAPATPSLTLTLSVPADYRITAQVMVRRPPPRPHPPPPPPLLSKNKPGAIQG